MKVSEAVQYMTKMYLQRVIDSFTKDFPKPTQERAREIVLDHAGELTDSERVTNQLDLTGYPYSKRALYWYVLETMLNDHDYTAPEAQIAEAVEEAEREIIEQASDEDSLQYEDKRAVDILRTVLEVAIEDGEITRDELRLVQRLRRHLGVQEKTVHVVLAQLDHFPRLGNEPHTLSEIQDALKDLQQRGVVFYCNRLEDGQYLIPEEIVPAVKKAIGFELGKKPWRKLLDNLTKSQIQTILEAEGLPQYGRKAQLIDRVIQAGIDPSEGLDQLKSSDLYDVLSGLPGATVRGTKDDRIERLIEYFDNLVFKEIDEEASPGELYYEYLVELAERDRENLLANDVIGKDRDMDTAFEEGTRFLFSEKLGLEGLDMTGSDHCDGCFEFRGGRELFMWDTKSKEGVYAFPRSHLRQFKRYIRDSDRRVSCFLVIVPETGEGVEEQAARLKIESRSDTDVSVIAAEDLKWVAEHWRERTKDAQFDLEVFNITGVLDRSTLERRMKLFL